MKRKNRKVTQEEKEILEGLTDEQKKKYLTKSMFLFLSFYISLLIIGFWLLFIDIYELFILENRAHHYTFSFVIIIPMSLWGLIDYIRKSKEKKIVNYYKFLHNNVKFDKKTMALLWFAGVCVMLLTVAVPIYHMCVDVGFNVVLLLISIAGIIFTGFYWFAVLRRKKGSETIDINVNNKDDSQGE